MNSLPTPPLLFLLQSVSSLTSLSRYLLDFLFPSAFLSLSSLFRRAPARSPQRVLPDGDLLCTVQSSVYESLTAADRLQHVASVYLRYSSLLLVAGERHRICICCELARKTSEARWGISDKSRPTASGEPGRTRALQENPYLHRSV